jgi:oligopeptide/dipeptide ABC transporter ATP-binding protein
MPSPRVETPRLAVRDLVTVYAPRPGLAGVKGVSVTAVDGISFDLAAGEALGIVGESGCGKSTLARTILRLVPATAGTVHMDGGDVLALAGDGLLAFRRRVQVVFQNPYDALDPRMRVLAIVREPLDVHARDLPRRERDDRARAALDEVGLGEEFARRYPHELSGGQRQRVGIARALVTRPDLLVCDEPVSSLDISIQAQILALLADLHGRLGLSMLFISHDLRVVRYLCDRALVLYRGRVMEAAPVEELLAAPLHPYTRLLLASVPALDPHRRATGRADTAVDETGAEGGCPFLLRCADAQPTCAAGRPEAREARPGHWVACPRADAHNPPGPK